MLQLMCEVWGGGGISWLFPEGRGKGSKLPLVHGLLGSGTGSIAAQGHGPLPPPPGPPDFFPFGPSDCAWG